MIWEEHQINSTFDKYSIVNKSGFNALSTVVVIDRNEYLNSRDRSTSILNHVKILDAHIPIEKNLLPNGWLSSQADIKKWVPLKGAKNLAFSYRQDDATERRPAMVVTKTDTTPEWSWIGSEWLNIDPNHSYEFLTNMKLINAVNSHIVLLGQDTQTGKETQLAQVPYATSGTSGWTKYHYELRIPSNYSRIRVVLNARWEKNPGANAETMFNGIQLVPLDEARSDFKLDNPNDVILSAKKINPTLRRLTLRNTPEPIFIATTDSFDEGWRAFVVPKNSKQNLIQWLSMRVPGKEIPRRSHIVANGFNNGWQVDRADYVDYLEGGNYQVTLEY